MRDKVAGGIFADAATRAAPLDYLSSDQRAVVLGIRFKLEQAVAGVAAKAKGIKKRSDQQIKARIRLALDRLQLAVSSLVHREMLSAEGVVGRTRPIVRPMVVQYCRLP